MYYKANFAISKYNDIIVLANEMMECYFKKSYDKVIQLSKNIMENILLVENAKSIKEALKKKKNMSEGQILIIHREYETVSSRFKVNQPNKLEKFMVDHQVRFIDYILFVFGYIKPEERIKELKDACIAFLDSKPFFDITKKESYSGYKYSFFRNAYRAEVYSGGIKSPKYPNIDIGRDMYTPLILCRMAIEQFVIKTCLDNKVDIKSPTNRAHNKPLADLINLLHSKKFITKELSQELQLVKDRGNRTTHNALVDAGFAIVHSLEVLRYCFNKM